MAQQQAGKSVKELQIERVLTQTEIIKFNERLFARDVNGWTPDIKRRLYDILGKGTPMSQLRDVMDYFSTINSNDEEYGHLIQFGDLIWNTRTLSFDHATELLPIHASPYTPANNPTHLQAVDKYLLELANGSEAVRDDILQALAPLLMFKKPSGIIWFVGDGANGKSSLIEALYRLFPGMLASVSTQALEDGRDVPVLNGHIGNVVRESSESHVTDAARYKSLGTHENFLVHQFRSQEMVPINGNIHTIFNANAIPTFSDKSRGVARRTLTIRFANTFEDDPGFEDRTFTPPFLSALLTRIMDTTRVLRDQGLRYQFSDVTTAAKEEYDAEANSVVAFARYMAEDHPAIAGWANFHFMEQQYQNWCHDNGYNALGTKNFRTSMRMLTGIDNHVFRVDGRLHRGWLFHLPDNRNVVAGTVVDVEIAAQQNPELYRNQEKLL